MEIPYFSTGLFTGMVEKGEKCGIGERINHQIL